jgi:hypothetical protein
MVTTVANPGILKRVALPICGAALDTMQRRRDCGPCRVVLAGDCRATPGCIRAPDLPETGRPAMSANNLYRGLFELLTLPLGAAESELSLATTQSSRRELLSVARMEGCLPELYARWDAAGLLSPSESIEHEQLARRRASVAEVLRVLPRGSLLAGAGGLQQGPSALDVLIPDFAAIGPLHEAVTRLGYRLQAGGEWRVPLRGSVLRGVATYRYATASASAGAVPIEVQLGGVALDARRCLPCVDFADKAARLEGSAGRALEATRGLLHRIAAFGAAAAPVTVRQIADIHLLLKSHAGRIDFAWLHRKIEQADAWAGLRQLRDAVAAKRLGAQLSWGEFGRLIEIGAARGEALAAARARNPRIGTFLKNGFELVPGPRANDIPARLARNAWLVTRVMEAGYRVRGVPVSTKTFDAPRLLRIDGALYLASGAGLILLSLVDLRDRARAALGERVRTGGRPVVLARWTAERARAGTR